jgi:hypothetical protein
VAIVGAFTFSVYFLVLLVAAPLIGRLLHRKTARRWRSQQATFPEHWRTILEREVVYYRALDQPDRRRFEKLMQVFLGDVRLTGVDTEVDDLTRVLVAASATIPIMGFDHWEYSRLGEVLIYPRGFDDQYQRVESTQQRALGMVGVGHLSGVMILSKPDLIGGFRNARDKHNVGIHEFAHLVDRGDGAIDGLPPGVDREVATPWIEWVGRELRSEGQPGHHIHDYAYTNEAEYFAVLTEYFFESPALLEEKAPEVYHQLEKMYRQKPRGLLKEVPKSRKRVGRNSPCPCGSGEKYKHCCLRKTRR